MTWIRRIKKAKGEGRKAKKRIYFKSHGKHGNCRNTLTVGQKYRVTS